MPLKGFWGKLDKIVAGYCSAIGFLTPALVAFIVVFICVDVFCRSVFNKPINGSIEIVQCLIAAAGFAAMARTTYADRHIRIDSLVNSLPPKAGFVVDVVMDVLPMTVIPIVVYASIRRFLDSVSSGEVTQILEWPMWPFLFIMCLGYLGMLLAQIMVIVKRVKEGVRERES